MRGRLMYGREFCLRLLQDRAAGVGILPKGQEILVSSLRFARVSRHDKRTRELQAGQGTDRIADYDPPVIKDALKFPYGFGPPARRQIRLATRIDRVICAKKSIDHAPRAAELIRDGSRGSSDAGSSSSGGHPLRL